MELITEMPWDKIEKTDTCWNWKGCIDTKGYGNIFPKGGRKRAHKVIYEFLFGAVPQGLELDHLCRNRACVNPKHLEPVTHRENMRRSLPFLERKTHCAKGHEFTIENTIHLARGNKKNQRVCRICKADVMKRYFEKHPRGRKRVHLQSNSGVSKNGD